MKQLSYQKTGRAVDIVYRIIDEIFFYEVVVMQ